MSLSKPEPGEQFGHADLPGPMIYVGKLSDGRWVLETVTGGTASVSATAALRELFPYLEPVEPLERGQRFERTRHDYTGQVAEVLATIESYDGATTFVAYHVHYGNSDSTPKLKDEVSFRRVFGRRAP